MKKQIKEVQKYFTDKIVKGDYENKMIGLTLNLIVDKKYQFTLWIGTSGADHISTHDYDNFMVLPFTTSQKNKIWNRVQLDQVKAIKAKKEEQFNKLKAELGK